MEKLGPIRSHEELEAILKNIREEYKDSLLLYRGQNQLFDNIRSGRSRPNYNPVPLVEQGWSALASKLLGLPREESHLGVVQAILQHYGCATHYVDLTSDINVAAWFATHRFQSTPRMFIGSAMRTYDIVNYTAAENGSVFIMVLAISDPKALQERDRLIDLSILPKQFERPFRQSAWLLLDRPPTRPLPDDFLIATIEIDTASYQNTLEDSLFPPGNEDLAFRTLATLPFVQFPAEYLQHRKEKEDGKGDEMSRSFEHLCFAMRALDIPEYSEEEDHKWNDLTIYEPHPMRMWRGWSAELEEMYGGIKGNIRDATKITVTPSAKILMNQSDEINLCWPQLEAKGCFFTFAALDHDKVIEHAPPYDGVWLQKDRDLIIEVPMVADEDTLSTCAGHCYFLRNGSIERQDMGPSCKCGDPESHDFRVASVLRLQGLVERGEIILLSHPRFESGWYFAVTGDDASLMQPAVESGYRIHRAIMDSLKSGARKSKYSQEQTKGGANKAREATP